MRPRQTCRGKSGGRAQPDRSANSFNEAAANMPRKVDMRGMFTAQIQGFNEAAANMPRKVLARSKAVSHDDRFNEAAANMPRKVLAVGTTPITGGTLQ